MKKEKKFFRFTFFPGKPVRDYGKIILLDKNRKWGLMEGVEYIIEEPVTLELERCIIIKSGSFLRVNDLLPTYEVTGGPYVDAEKREINFSVRRTVMYRQEVLDTETDYKNFTFGLNGNEEFYDLLPVKAQKQVDDFRSYIEWISENQLSVLGGGTSDFLAHRAFRLVSDTESLKIRETGSGLPENPKEVSVLKLQKLVYQPVFQEGFEPTVAEDPREIVKTLATLTLEESGLPFSFRLVWKSPTMMVGVLTVNGEEVQGLVQCPGDGTGSHLDAVMYLGLMEMPPSRLSQDDLEWVNAGGRICWVYQFSSNDVTKELIYKTTNPPADPTGWVKVNTVYDNGNGSVRYIQDTFENIDYMKLVDESKKKSK